jgi:hypothetical protein
MPFVGKYCRLEQATYEYMGHAHCMLDTKGYKTHPEYVLLIVFPNLQWLQERTSVLRYTDIAFLFIACACAS